MSPSAQNFTTDLAPQELPFSNHSVGSGAVQSSTQRHGTRPDWILYTVPGSAFLLGLCLFSLVLGVNRRRQREVVQQHGFERQRQRQAERRYSSDRTNGFRPNSWDTSVDVLKARSVETISYENVEAVIYSNQQGVSYHVAMDDKDDYLTPDADADPVYERETAQNHFDAVHSLYHQTDTDGESYENMYAHPRRARDTSSAEEDDYINAESGKLAAPEDNEEKDQGDYLCPVKDDTDGESYEDMDGTAALQRAPTVTHHEEEDSYERMDSINPWSPGGADSEQHARRDKCDSRRRL